MSRKAAKHYAKNRVRCPDWETDFCVKCRVQPYHIGFSWKEYKKIKKGKKWRYWGELVKKDKSKKGAFKYIWDSQECIDQIKSSWDRVLGWGHPCKGFAGEEYWLPWLHPDCVENNPEPTLEQDDDTFWSIWYISGLGDQPCVQLGWKHIFHVDCIAEKVRQKWAGPRITLMFKTCPSWKEEIECDHHPEISQLLEEAREFEKIITEKAVERAKAEGIHKDKRLKDKNDEYYNNLEKYAMARLSYYTCFKWGCFYYGGLKEWGNMLEADGNFNPEELVWGKWSSEGLAGQVDCPKHGKEFIEFKWRYCCSLSQWYWFGTTHFWDSWHRTPALTKPKKWSKDGTWGINVDHPDDGSEFALGWGLCRNAAGRGS